MNMNKSLLMCMAAVFAIAAVPTSAADPIDDVNDAVDDAQETVLEVFFCQYHGEGDDCEPAADQAIAAYNTARGLACDEVPRTCTVLPPL